MTQDLQPPFGEGLQPPFDDSALGHAISAARSARGMTLDMLAGASGVSRRSLSYIEAGTNSPTAKTLHAIAHAVGIPVGDLIRAGCVDGVYGPYPFPGQNS